jgi:hypothetical protein
MNLKTLIARVFAAVLMGSLVGALLLGLAGLLLAGWQGLLNGATWGALLGIFAGVAMSQFVEWSYWTNFMTRLGNNLQKSDGE